MLGPLGEANFSARRTTHGLIQNDLRQVASPKPHPIQPIYNPKAITHSSKQRGCPAAGIFFVTAQGRRSSGPSGGGNSPGETVVEMLNDILKNGWRNIAIYG